MAAIAHASRVNATNQTTTNNGYVDATNGDIASGSFTTGKKYLIVASAQLGIATTAASCGCRIVHGTTAFDDSEQLYATALANARIAYAWWTVWTAVSGEGIKIQYSSNAAGNTVGLNFIVLFAMNLSDDLVENTDWFWSERATDDALTDTDFAGGSVTFTPAVASQRWLVMTNAQMNLGANTRLGTSVLTRSGEASVGLPVAQQERATVFISQFTLAKASILGAVSNTFAEAAAETGGDITRLHSRVIAINLTKFKNHEYSENASSVNLSATNYATQLRTISITPDVTGDVWVGAFCDFDVGNASREIEFRIQRGNADEPAGQTTANYQFDAANDAANELPQFTQCFPSLTAATAYTFDFDASTDATTGTPKCWDQALWAVTMELAEAAAQSVVPILARQYRQRRI
jgi:hypothetical protein